MRGIESAVAVILLLIMSVALVAVLYMIFGPALKHASKTTASSMSSSAKQQAQQASRSNEKAICSNMGENAVYEAHVPAQPYPIKLNGTTYYIENNGADVPVCVYQEGSNYFIACWNSKTNDFNVVQVNSSLSIDSSNPTNFTC